MRDRACMCVHARCQSGWSWRTSERSRLGNRAVLGVCGDDALARAERRRHCHGQLLLDLANLGVVLGQLTQPLLQRVLQQVQLLTGVIQHRLGLNREREGSNDSKTKTNKQKE